MSKAKQRPIIDELVDEYFPRIDYFASTRKKAKKLALEFFKSARQEYAMQDQINTALFLGRELTGEENERILQRWGF